MKLIVGLGNPGLRYRLTRHNAGFLAVDRIAAELGTRLASRKAKAKIGRGSILREQVLLAKPLTYMNRSGESVARLLEGTGIGIDDLLIICDDINLEPGVIRLRRRGGAGGHNGLSSIIERLGTQDFSRLRVGVGRPPGSADQESFVLRPFPPQSRRLMAEVFKRAAEAAVLWVKEGIEAAMNEYNTRNLP